MLHSGALRSCIMGSGRELSLFASPFSRHFLLSLSIVSASWVRRWERCCGSFVISTLGPSELLHHPALSRDIRVRRLQIVLSLSVCCEMSRLGTLQLGATCPWMVVAQVVKDRHPRFVLRKENKYADTVFVEGFSSTRSSHRVCRVSIRTTDRRRIVGDFSWSAQNIGRGRVFYLLLPVTRSTDCPQK